MRSVLLLGGYGGFGARIAPRLVAEGFTVLVAGRSRERAERFCAGRTGMVPLALDRDRDLAAALAARRPFAVVDAAGPFQGSSYAVAEACMAAGCHYLDIADGRDFVAGIGALDARARAAGVAVISGASSVPALSGAAARHLAAGLDEVRDVAVAISASHRAAAGASVTRAILSYVGRPVRLWRGGRWTEAFGWGERRRESFAVAGIAPIRGRLVGIADVPDLALLPDRLPGRPAVTFRAGTEFDVANLALAGLGVLVRAGLLGSPEPLAPALIALQRRTAAWGSGRSGMIVRLVGMRAGQGVERCWTLVADRGDGPEIPGLAVPILLRRLAEGAVAPGARDAGEILALDAFEPAFAGLAIRHETTERERPPPLYRRVLGARFDRLPGPVRAMHEVQGDAGASGRATVTRGRSPLARLVAALMRFPPEGQHPVHVEFREEGGIETWTRSFGPHRFRSRLRETGGRLEERFGPLRFRFDLAADETGLAMVLRGWSLGPLPLPVALAPRSPAREWEEEGRFHFDVPIALPLVGPVVHYRGWLDPPSLLPVADGEKSSRASA